MLRVLLTSALVLASNGLLRTPGPKTHRDFIRLFRSEVNAKKVHVSSYEAAWLAMKGKVVNRTRKLLRLRKPSFAASSSSSCLRGARILVAIACYGTQMQTWLELSIVLRSLRNLHALTRTRVQIMLDVTAEPPHRLLRQWQHWMQTHNVLVNLTKHSASIGEELSGAYRKYFWESLSERRYDYYMVVENDINVTMNNVEALCRESHYLAGTGNLMPGLMRYEVERPSPEDLPGADQRFLIDAPLFFGRCLNHRLLICDVVKVRGRPYVIPVNPYQAMWFLSSKALRSAIKMYTRIHRKPRAWLQDTRIFKVSRTLEEHSYFWLNNALIFKVVPLDNFLQHLVHHLSNKYVVPGEYIPRAIPPEKCNASFPSVKQFLELAIYARDMYTDNMVPLLE